MMRSRDPQHVAIIRMVMDVGQGPLVVIVFLVTLKEEGSPGK